MVFEHSPLLKVPQPMHWAQHPPVDAPKVVVGSIMLFWNVRAKMDKKSGNDGGGGAGEGGCDVDGATQRLSFWLDISTDICNDKLTIQICLMLMNIKRFNIMLFYKKQQFWIGMCINHMNKQIN